MRRPPARGRRAARRPWQWRRATPPPTRRPPEKQKSRCVSRLWRTGAELRPEACLFPQQRVHGFHGGGVGGRHQRQRAALRQANARRSHRHHHVRVVRVRQLAQRAAQRCQERAGAGRQSQAPDGWRGPGRRSNPCALHATPRSGRRQPHAAPRSSKQRPATYARCLRVDAFGRSAAFSASLSERSPRAEQRRHAPLLLSVVQPACSCCVACAAPVRGAMGRVSRRSARAASLAPGAPLPLEGVHPSDGAWEAAALVDGELVRTRRNARVAMLRQ